MKSQMRLTRHVWICGGPGWATTQVYPALKLSLFTSFPDMA